jgi:hypothetical protein
MAGEATVSIGSEDYGWIQSSRGARPIVIAAPHGGYDLNTEQIARLVARRLEASCLVALRFRSSTHPINVNRPTEGVDLPAAQEVVTPRATAVYEAYRAVEQDLASPSLRLYVEVHGNHRPRSAGRLEVATQGFGLAEAALLKSRYAELGPELPPVDVEPVDPIYFTASAAKRYGILKGMPRALHIEVPAGLREDPAAWDLAAEAIATLVEVAAKQSGVD